MANAKDLIVKPIKSQDANALVKRLHYSGKVVSNSQLHLGVFLDGRLEGAMQFGCSLDKRRTIGLVANTGWNDFLELNRMAFSAALPRNSESRAIGIAMRIIKKNYPNIKWIISFADGCQCGDGTIYRASGFVLTGIKKNTTIWEAPTGEKFTDIGLRTGAGEKGKAMEIINRTPHAKGKHAVTGASSMALYKKAGFKPLDGFQLRYVYFIDPSARDRLTVPILPFSKIDEMGAGMYKGKARVKQAMSGDQPEQRRGSTDLHAPKTGAENA